MFIFSFKLLIIRLYYYFFAFLTIISFSGIYGRRKGKTISLKDYYKSFEYQCEACGQYKGDEEINTHYNIDICDDCYSLVGKIV
jgi:hypothetical protein